MKGNELMEFKNPDLNIVTVVLSENNEYIAIVNSDSSGYVGNMNGDRIFEFPVALNQVYNRNVIEFSPDSKYLAVAGMDYKVILYDVKGNKIQELTGHKGSVNYLSFSPDNRFIATASDDKKVFIWNYNSHINLFGLYDSITSHWYKVRSCNFSHDSKYILTAADDSTIRISNLYGEVTYRMWIGGSPENRLEHACNAEFSEDENCILITRYKSSVSDTIPCYQADCISYSQSLFYDKSTGYDDYLYSTRSKLVRSVLDNYPWFELVWSFEDGKSIAYDANNKMVSMGSAHKNNIILVSDDLLPLIQLNGYAPSFSPDGKYLLYINGNELATIPVTSQEIIRLVTEEKVFGEIGSDPQDWFNIF